MDVNRAYEILKELKDKGLGGYVIKIVKYQFKSNAGIGTDIVKIAKSTEEFKVGQGCTIEITEKIDYE